MRASVLDLFCGAGGLTHGFVLEGFRVVAGMDIDPACKFPYEHNNRATFVERNVADLSGDDILSLYPPGDIRILAGCAPCQPFSTYSQAAPRRSTRRWRLLDSFGDFVARASPQIVTMENVPQLTDRKVFKDFVARLQALNYHISIHERVTCAGYGIPQTRQRLVLLASALGPIDLVAPTHQVGSYVTVEHAIGDLPPIPAGGACPTDPLHKAQNLSKLNLRRIRASRPGGSWRDWDRRLRADCHSRETGRTYPSVYGRMKWDNLAPTITAQCYGFGNGRFGHPEQDRAISLREAALLQTFPRRYEFVPPGRPVHFSTIGRLIGNAVPVLLARAIARSIKQHLEATNG